MRLLSDHGAERRPAKRSQCIAAAVVWQMVVFKVRP